MKKYLKLVHFFLSLACVVFIVLSVVCDIFSKNDFLKVSMRIISNLFTITFSIISLYFVIFELTYNEVITKHEAKKMGMKIAKIIDNMKPKYLIFVSGNSYKFLEMYVFKNLNKTPKIIQFEPIERTDTGLFYNKNLSKPNYLIISKKFYLKSNSDQLSHITNDDKILFFDDIVITGDTANSIINFLKKVRRLPSACFYFLALMIDTNLRNTGLINEWLKSGNLKDTSKYHWRDNNE